jgi:hypothetical protein
MGSQHPNEERQAHRRAVGCASDTERSKALVQAVGAERGWGPGAEDGGQRLGGGDLGGVGAVMVAMRSMLGRRLSCRSTVSSARVGVRPARRATARMCFSQAQAEGRCLVMSQVQLLAMRSIDEHAG